MKVLFDANVPKQLRRLLRNHSISTAQEQRWGKIDDGKLLNAAEAADFEVLVTCDKNIAYQQNLKRRKIALVVLSTNDWSILRKAGPIVGAALDAARACSFQMVDVQCGAP